MFPLKGKVQHYAWGGKSFIPELLGISNTENSPFAEYWMGVHHAAPSMVQLSENAHTALDNLIRSEPRRYLGQRLIPLFHELPFLLKVLDVNNMLSIQVHPAKEDAIIGFELENAAGIPHDAPNRNYKDNNHKPEVMLALSEFWLLHGFRSHEDLAGILDRVEPLQVLLPVFESLGYRGLYQFVMDLPQESVNRLLQPLADKILPMYVQGKLSRADPDFWAARAMVSFPEYLDRGIFSIYFFNLLKLEAGQAIFQEAGVPHAYLEGKNIELMSNSDNVLRGGLTQKHIDVPELMKHVKFETTIPEIMDGRVDQFERIYLCPVPDFSLSILEIPAETDYNHKADGPEILFVMEGKGRVEGAAAWDLYKGLSYFVSDGENLTFRSLSGLKLVRAWVP
jgi:mannose-6-phosphate isomerase